MLEACVLISHRGEPIHWHLPANRTIGSLPDSPDLWDVIWENRKILLGIAHTHPGSGHLGCRPSMEDLTTFQAVEDGLNRRIFWWISNQDWFNLIRYKGPGPYDYTINGASCKINEGPNWLFDLRKHSGFRLTRD